jgi:hypothetical protein
MAIPLPSLNRLPYRTDYSSESELLYRQSVLVTTSWRITTSNFIFQLNTCGHSPYVTSSLTRGWVCSLQLLLALASAVILRSQSRGTRDHVLLAQIRESPNLKGQVPVFISPRNRVARGTGFSFRRLLRVTGLQWRYCNPPPHEQSRKHRF